MTERTVVLWTPFLKHIFCGVFHIVGNVVLWISILCSLDSCLDQYLLVNSPPCFRKYRCKSTFYNIKKVDILSMYLFIYLFICLSVCPSVTTPYSFPFLSDSKLRRVTQPLPRYPNIPHPWVPCPPTRGVKKDSAP